MQSPRGVTGDVHVLPTHGKEAAQGVQSASALQLGILLCAHVVAIPNTRGFLPLLLAGEDKLCDLGHFCVPTMADTGFELSDL